MNNEDEFTRRLMGFGLTEKEAHCYFYLLKYGPKTPSPLAKALDTYREDMHRTLNSLIDKGMVRPSLDSPTIYTAVELESALQSGLKKHETELREMELRKQELAELARRHASKPTNEVSHRVLKSVREVVSAGLPIIQTAEKEILWIAPREGMIVASRFGIFDVLREVIRRGVQCRGITDITLSTLPFVQEALDIGEQVRHYTDYRGLFYNVFDGVHCLSAININMKRCTLDEPISMLLSNDAVYASYLASTFELLWKQALPAERRIQELVKQSPPQAKRQPAEQY